ncbi:hypothetical protein [Rhizobium sp. TRM95796]|uniref:hypothetical protein n=1 Tax=Rhizobium sp. TRM95796 TaxID=2979862 RepID=UPI0021E754E3|nr:hypothetical protein [Rhizobium sp. TRM95796]MCV3765156.1 hypothetical protein [Rhizobium sp. TRM95796]
MTSKLKTIPGLTFNLLVEEVNERDREGRRLLYLASVYLQVRGSSRLYLIRRSRLPGAAILFERDARLGRIDVGHFVDVMKVNLPIA